MNTETIKTRFAPSPTGLMHIGNARTALFNALYAHHHGGIFLLRIEDTDLERSQAPLAIQLMEDLHWLNITWQEGAYYQSKRGEIYTKYYAQLEQQGKVYPCFCTRISLIAQTATGFRATPPLCRHLYPSQRNRGGS